MNLVHSCYLDVILFNRTFFIFLERTKHVFIVQRESKYTFDVQLDWIFFCKDDIH